MVILIIGRYTRYGNEVSLLPSMINSLPLVVTDNELWYVKCNINNYNNIILIKFCAG